MDLNVRFFNHLLNRSISVEGATWFEWQPEPLPILADAAPEETPRQEWFDMMAKFLAKLDKKKFHLLIVHAGGDIAHWLRWAGDHADRLVLLAVSSVPGSIAKQVDELPDNTCVWDFPLPERHHGPEYVNEFHVALDCAIRKLARIMQSKSSPPIGTGTWKSVKTNSFNFNDREKSLVKFDAASRFLAGRSFDDIHRGSWELLTRNIPNWEDLDDLALRRAVESEWVRIARKPNIGCIQWERDRHELNHGVLKHRFLHLLERPGESDETVALLSQWADSYRDEFAELLRRAIPECSRNPVFQAMIHVALSADCDAKFSRQFKVERTRHEAEFPEDARQSVECARNAFDRFDACVEEAKKNGSIEEVLQAGRQLEEAIKALSITSFDK